MKLNICYRPTRTYIVTSSHYRRKSISRWIPKVSLLLAHERTITYISSHAWRWREKFFRNVGTPEYAGCRFLRNFSQTLQSITIQNTVVTKYSPPFCRSFIVISRFTVPMWLHFPYTQLSHLNAQCWEEVISSPGIWRHKSDINLSTFLMTWCLLDRASLWQLKNKKPTRRHLLFYCTSYRLNMIRALLCPSSGAHDCDVDYHIGSFVLDLLLVGG